MVPARWPATPSVLALGLLASLAARGAQAAVSEQEEKQLRCPVCKLAVAEAAALVVELAVDRKNEDDVIDFVDRLCVMSKREGRWLRRLDVQNSGDGLLTVENKTEYGNCRTECLLVRKACQSALGKKQEALVELLQAGEPDATKLQAKICKASCSKKPTPLKYKRVDEPWEAGFDEGMLQMMENRDKLREETGQVMEVMSREDMEKMSDGDKEVQAAQDAFAQQMREAREDRGLDWKGNEL